MMSCKGFPDGCPHLIEIPADLSGHGGGVRCGCVRALNDMETGLRSLNDIWARINQAIEETQAALDELREKIFGPPDSVIHACPPDGSGLTPCCRRAPGELPHTDRIAIDDVPITCPGVSP